MAEVTMESVVESMKEAALKRPFNQDREFLAPPPLARKIIFEGMEYEVMLTYNLWDSIKRRCWQFSVSTTNGLPVNDSTARRMATAFLGTGYEEIKFPPVMLLAMEAEIREMITSGRQRQFMKETKLETSTRTTGKGLSGSCVPTRC